MDLFKKFFSEKNDGDEKDTKKIPTHLSPLDLQKLIEQQMKDMLKNLDNIDEDKVFEENVLDEFSEPDYGSQLRQFFDSYPQTAMIDIELNGKLSPHDIENFLQLPANLRTPKFQPISLPSNKKRTEDEKIMDKIHGTAPEEVVTPRRNRLPQANNKQSLIQQPQSRTMPSITPSTGFETYSSSNSSNYRTFGQSIVSQTIRKPDGSYETKRVVRDSNGKTVTTITKSIDGKTETIVSDIGSGNTNLILANQSLSANERGKKSILNVDQNMRTTKDGYTVPLNLW